MYLVWSKQGWLYYADIILFHKNKLYNNNKAEIEESGLVG